MIYMKIFKTLFAILLAAMIVLSLSVAVFAETPEPSPAPIPTEPTPAAVETADNSENVVRDYKAISAAIIIAVVAGLGAVAMAMTIMKTIDGIARQPEAAGNIRGAMMLGLVFIETAIIYALIVAILVVFVL